MFYRFQETVRTSITDKVQSFFDANSSDYTNILTRIPTIKEWKSGGFEEASVFIDKIYPDNAKDFPAIVVGISGISQESIGIGDFVGHYEDTDTGITYARYGIKLSGNISVMVGTRSEPQRESMLDLLTGLFSRLTHDTIYDDYYWYEINDDISVGSYTEEELGGVSGIQKIYSAEISFTFIMEGYDDVELVTVGGMQQTTHDQFAATDLDGTGTNTLVPSQDDTIF